MVAAIEIIRKQSKLIMVDHDHDALQLVTTGGLLLKNPQIMTRELTLREIITTIRGGRRLNRKIS
jgi:hypothetical protein